MSDLSNDTKKHTTKSRETIPLRQNKLEIKFTKCRKDRKEKNYKREDIKYKREVIKLLIDPQGNFEEHLKLRTLGRAHKRLFSLEILYII
jgi:hypothetical protein